MDERQNRALSGIQMPRMGSMSGRKLIAFATVYEVVEILKEDIVNPDASFAFVSEPIDTLPGCWEECLLWVTARPGFYHADHGE